MHQQPSHKPHQCPPPMNKFKLLSASMSVPEMEKPVKLLQTDCLKIYARYKEPFQRLQTLGYTHHSDSSSYLRYKTVLKPTDHLDHKNCINIPFQSSVEDMVLLIKAHFTSLYVLPLDVCVAKKINQSQFPRRLKHSLSQTLTNEMMESIKTLVKKE